MRQAVSAETTAAARVRTATFSVVAFGVLLAVAFFPMAFSKLSLVDDDGALLATLNEFLKHGSLYDHTHGAYGPFYYSFMGLMYRLTGQEPTLFGARLLALAFTTAAAAMFAATVWRVTRSLAFTLLAEAVTFAMLIEVAGGVPSHPGPLIVLVVSILVFALASYALDQRTVFLVWAGFAVGALLMTKINVGLLAATAVAVGFVVGNRAYPKAWRAITATAAVLFPFALMFQRLYLISIAEFGLLVSVGLLLSYAPMHVDEIALRRRALGTVAVAAIVPMVASALWPLLHGTSPGALFRALVIQPLGQADNFTAEPGIDFVWLAFVSTVGIAYVAVAKKNEDGEPTLFGNSWVPNVAFGLAALYVLGLGTVGGVRTNSLAWLPAIAMIPALAWLTAVPAKIRLVLRFLVPVAILQMLHAYPVAGLQRAWGAVAMCVPCVIAIAIATERLPLWLAAGRAERAALVGALGVVLVLTASVSPIAAWHDYEQATPLRLPGARLIRVGASEVVTLTRLTQVVKRDCDTFYAAPGLGSLYFFTKLPAPTGHLANWPGVLNEREQRDVAADLARLSSSGKRVCIVRDLHRQKEWLQSSYGKGPLGKSLARYRAPLAVVGHFSVSGEGRA